MATDSSTTSSHEIAIFWDYENVPLPNWCNATQAAKAIVDAVSQYGRIVDRRLYYDFNHSQSIRDCSSLDSSGFDLVNTPTRNNKETLDKKLIADVLTFAWDSAVRNDTNKPCVVLLTGDGDYAYTLSKLRDRGIMTVVMVGRDCTVASILVDTADVAMSLEDDVLKDMQTTSHALASKPRTGTRSTNTFPENQKENPMMVTICDSVQRATESSPDGWSEFGSVAVAIQRAIRQTKPNAPPEVIKESAKVERQKAESNGLIEIGRRKLDSNGTDRQIIVSNDRRLKLSSEVYVRLLPKGQELLQQSNTTPRKQQQLKVSPNAKRPRDDSSSTMSSPKNPKAILFLPRLPKGTDVRDLVTYLEDTFHVTVRRALVDGPNAHVEFVDSNDAGVILRAANKKGGGDGISFQGHSLGVVANYLANPFESKGSKEEYYENQSTSSPASRKPVPGQERKASNVQDVDTSDDTKKFCLSIYLDASKGGQESDRWVGAGPASANFRSRMGTEYLKTASKEDVHTRYKQARTKSIQDGLVKVGRRDLSSNDNTVYVAISLAGISSYDKDSNLSSELYLRLLPAGQTVAVEAEEEFGQSSSSMKPRSKFIFLSNLPTSTTATQLVQYLETLECQVHTIVLEERKLKQGSARGAHVECVSVDDATRLFRKSKSPGGLVYCGRSVYVVPDRFVPTKDNRPEASLASDMIYTRDVSPTVASTLETNIDLMDSSVPSELRAPEVEEREFYVIGEDTNHVVSPESKASDDQNDPFEGIQDLSS